MSEGLLQVYSGEGQGKMTAATGPLMRALGQGWRVLLVRFLKPAEPVGGEIRLLKEFGHLTLIEAGQGIIGRSIDRRLLQDSVANTFSAALSELSDSDYRLVVFDELTNCFQRGLLPRSVFEEFLHQKASALEVVVTGRNAPEELLAQADLVTHMDKMRRPYDRGVAAREGIDY